MSLLRLLTAGKCLVGLRDSEHRYRVPRQRVLPKFDARANPFMTVSKPGEGERPQEKPVPPEATASPCEDQAAPEPVQIEPPSVVVGEPSPERPSAAPCRPGFLSRVLRRGDPTHRKARDVRSEALVQGELSLEAVKVVRNDLNDSDLDLAPAPARKAAFPAPGSHASPAGAAAVGTRPGAWGRVSSRLFGAGKS